MMLHQIFGYLSSNYFKLKCFKLTPLIKVYIYLDLNMYVINDILFRITKAFNYFTFHIYKRGKGNLI